MEKNIKAGLNIKRLRKERKLTQEELANRIGVTASLISMYESGQRTPSDEIKLKISKELKRSVGFIFFS